MHVFNQYVHIGCFKVVFTKKLVKCVFESYKYSETHLMTFLITSLNDTQQPTRKLISMENKVDEDVNGCFPDNKTLKKKC